MSRVLTDALTKLVSAANGCFASSQLTPSQRTALDNLAQQTGCLRRSPQGRGSVYHVVNEAQLRLHLKALQPITPQNIDYTLPKRSINLALYRQSKSQAHGHEVNYLLLKAINGAMVNWHHDTKTLPLSEITKIAGCASLMIEKADLWTSNHPLWLVENQEVFDDLSWLPASATGTIIYYAGNVTNLMIDWLASKQRCSELILFADYDGVGLSNFLRLYERVGQHCQFWLMPDWQQKLQQMGDNDIWIKNRSLFEATVTKLESLAMPVNLQLLINTMRQQGLALEQEAVFF